MRKRKRAYAIHIASILKIKKPKKDKGGTIAKTWFARAIREVPDCEEVDVGRLDKIPLVRKAVEVMGGQWDPETCEAEGSTVTGDGVGRLLFRIEPRTEEMYAIWQLMGRGGEIEKDHWEFMKIVYSHTIGEEPDESGAGMLEGLLKTINENHGLTEQEIVFEGVPTLIVYQEVRSHLSSLPTEYDIVEELDDSDIVEELDGLELEDEELIDRMARTEVEATQVASLITEYEDGFLDLNPPWQRGNVWSTKKKKAVIESILMGIPLPSIILHVKTGTGKIEVIDGQQRLRSIVGFVKNEFPLAKFKPGHDLHDVSGYYWDHDTRKSLSTLDDGYLRMCFRHSKIPVLKFFDVPESRLRKVFHLYNTAALKLNAAEIRNATYQSNKIHRMAFMLAGENEDAEVGWYDDDLREFTDDLRDTLGNPKRFGTTNFICRYLAHSRPFRAPNSNVFKGASTNGSINRFLDRYSEADFEDLANEVRDCYYFCADNFELDEDHRPFEKLNDRGEPKKNDLVAVTNMVASRLLIGLREGGIIEEGVIETALREAFSEVEFPENQNAATIWGYQADVINGLLEGLGLESTDSRVVGLFPHLVPCMDEIRNPE